MQVVRRTVALSFKSSSNQITLIWKNPASAGFFLAVVRNTLPIQGMVARPFLCISHRRPSASDSTGIRKSLSVMKSKSRESSPGDLAPRHGLARYLSKLGICSRSQAELFIRAGRVSVDARIIKDPWYPMATGKHRVKLDGEPLRVVARVYVMLNKPRNKVVSASDEQGRPTVYSAFEGAGLPWIGPVGRLDKASEGLLLFSNDTLWSSAISAPDSRTEKTYHVQISGHPGNEVLLAMCKGVQDGPDLLRARCVTLLRSGEKTAWLEIVLDEGRNRQIRRMLAAWNFNVLRLVRVKIGALSLGELPKDQWRHLTESEVASLCAGAASVRGDNARLC